MRSVSRSFVGFLVLIAATYTVLAKSDSTTIARQVDSAFRHINTGLDTKWEIKSRAQYPSGLLIYSLERGGIPTRVRVSYNDSNDAVKEMFKGEKELNVSTPRVVDLGDEAVSYDFRDEACRLLIRMENVFMELDSGKRKDIMDVATTFLKAIDIATGKQSAPNPILAADSEEQPADYLARIDTAIDKKRWAGGRWKIEYRSTQDGTMWPDGVLRASQSSRVIHLSESVYHLTTKSSTNTIRITVAANEAEAHELFNFNVHSTQIGPHEIHNLGDEASMTCNDPEGRQAGSVMVKSGRVCLTCGGIVNDSIEQARVFLDAIKEVSGR